VSRGWPECCTGFSSGIICAPRKSKSECDNLGVECEMEAFGGHGGAFGGQLGLDLAHAHLEKLDGLLLTVWKTR
jgi:hypothetical protein